jgi:hypothetical protein
MDRTPQHQCLVYDGPPSRHLSALAAVMKQKLHEGNRCLFLNSEPMVAGMRSYLAATGVDVAEETARTSLVLSSSQDHLVNGHFYLERMICTLQDALEQALSDGYEGIWATGDMTWELGPDKDFLKLLEYEFRLEQFLRDNPRISGICQYHAELIPQQFVRQGLLVHSSIFVNQTLSLLNPFYCQGEKEMKHTSLTTEMDMFVNRLVQYEA